MKIYNKNVENLKDFLSVVFADEGKEVIDALERAFVSNGIPNLEGLSMYGIYSTANKGCSLDNPFVIEETENYVFLEYLIVSFLKHMRKDFYPMMKLNGQKLLKRNNRDIDVLRFDVYRNNEDIQRGNVVCEEYFFDITVGFGAKG